VEEGAGGAIVEGAVAAPEAELATSIGEHFFGGEAQKGEAGGGCMRVDVGKPAVELPAHALGQGQRRGSFESPAANEGLAVLGLGLDAQARQGQAAC